MTSNNCGQCRFWQADKPLGECHRRAPLPVFSGDDRDLEAIWPKTDEHDWCGEFESDLV